MRTSTVFVMLLLVVAASAGEEKPPGNNTVPTNTQAPEPKPSITQTPERKPIDEEERRETENREGGRGIDGSAPQEPAVNEGGSAVDGQSAGSSEEATSMTSGGMKVGGFAAVAATLTYLF
ncbi:hypothetical protein CAEBREN_02037 [Caenorhabditis brenneri]|uniref:Uncharacterized protein n=1 Tax=Caenorhabditis brenneri TaxID=135651 RepID=G0NK41_CAEBE|nr:hypothetical protein CAEBREN_02037 [Caenorhabditis brenneri]